METVGSEALGGYGKPQYALADGGDRQGSIYQVCQHAECGMSLAPWSMPANRDATCCSWKTRHGRWKRCTLELLMDMASHNMRLLVVGTAWHRFLSFGSMLSASCLYATMSRILYVTCHAHAVVNDAQICGCSTCIYTYM